jgi:hypothetical protein
MVRGRKGSRWFNRPRAWCGNVRGTDAGRRDKANRVSTRSAMIAAGRCDDSLDVTRMTN